MRFIYEVRSGFHLAWRYKASAIGITFMITVICIVLVAALADVITQTSVIVGAKQLRANNAVTFTPYYLEAKETEPSEDFMGELSKQITKGQLTR